MVFLRWRSGRIVSFTNAGGRAPCAELTIRPLCRLKITFEVFFFFVIGFNILDHMHYVLTGCAEAG